MRDPIASIFEEIGSEKPIQQLVESFYAKVEQDKVLRPLYPEDLTQPKRFLTLFLIQRFGGPSTYSEERGHPRMRARHMPFKIGVKEKEAWMANMMSALETVPKLTSHKELLQKYFDDFANFMINQPS